VSQVLQVFIFKAGQFQGTEMAMGDQIEIGRDPNCAVVLDDDSCSRRHALIFSHQGQYAVQDLGSANGTRVNNEAITAPRFITSRDEIGVGVYSIKIKPMAAQQPVPSAPPMAAPPPTQLLDPAAHGVAPAPAPVAAAPTPAASQAAAPTPQAVPHAAQAPATVAAPSGMAPQGAIPPSVDAQPTVPAMAQPGGSPQPPPGPLGDVPHTFEPSGPNAGAPGPGHDLPPPATAPAAAAPAAPLAAAPQPAAAPVSTEGLAPVSFSWTPGVRDEIPVPQDDDALAAEWSLIDNLLRERQVVGKVKESVVEVIHYRGQHVFDKQVLREGESFSFGRNLSREDLEARGLKKPIRLVAHGKKNVGELTVSNSTQGQVVRNGAPIQLSQLPEASSGKVPLVDGELAQLAVGGDHVLVRFSKITSLPNEEAYDREAARERKRNTMITGAALGLIGAMMLGSWIYSYMNPPEQIISLEDDGFAEVKKEIELELKEKPKPKPKPKKAAPAKKDQPKAPKPDPVPEKKAGGQENAPKKPGVLDALKNIPKPNAGRQSLTKALSNVKGVKTPGASNFKVSSMVGKGVKGVSIGGASGGVSTSSLNSILRKGGGGKGPGSLSSLGGKRVKGKVKALKRSAKTKGKGSLSKDEIMKVLRTLFGKIQYCYEKQLRTNPGLHGKVIFEWEIKKNGRVGFVKSGSGTTLKSAAAVNCMKGKLKSAAFPKPRGNGSVIVKFPFVFNTL